MRQKELKLQRELNNDNYSIEKTLKACAATFFMELVTTKHDQEKDEIKAQSPYNKLYSKC